MNDDDKMRLAMRRAAVRAKGIDMARQGLIDVASADGFSAFSRLHNILDRALITTEGITPKQRREILKKVDNIILHDEQLRTLLMEVLHYDH